MTAGPTTLYLITPPQQREDAAETGLSLVHPLYRVNRGRLMRMGNAPPPTGGLLLLGGHLGNQGSPQILAQDIMGECTARSYTGILLDPEGAVTPLLQKVIPLLEDMAIQRGWIFYLTESYGTYATRAGVLISSAISGGSLEGRIVQAQETFGQNRVALTLQPVAEDFSLPSLNGQGIPLSPSELAALRQSLTPSVFYSQELCTHYFTYLKGNRGHMVLFDDQESLEKKRVVAAGLGVRRFFAAYPQVKEFLPVK